MNLMIRSSDIDVAVVIKKYINALPANPTMIKTLRDPTLSETEPQSGAKMIYATISTVMNQLPSASDTENLSITNSGNIGAIKVKLNIAKKTKDANTPISSLFGIDVDLSSAIYHPLVS
jgi:hypothetical protein